MNNPNPIPTGYSGHYEEYAQKGWKPIPISRSGGKGGVAADCTGHAGTVTPEKMTRWALDPVWANENIGLRLEGVLGFDLDHYNKKKGDDQYWHLVGEMDGEELPKTYSMTARGQGQPSRTYFFRVPEDAYFHGQAATDIETLQKSHRYALAYPSIHPNVKQPYQWYAPEGQPCGIPNVKDLAELNTNSAWYQYLLKSSSRPSYSTGGSIDASKVDLKEWTDTLSAGEVTDELRAKLWEKDPEQRAKSYRDGRYDATEAAIWSLSRLSVFYPETPGLAALQQEIYEARMSSTSATTPGQKRSEAFLQSTKNAIAKWTAIREEHPLPTAQQIAWAEQVGVASRTDSSDVTYGAPSRFFEKGSLKTKTLAEAVSHNVGLGPDGSFWEYVNGVYKPSADIVSHRLTRALGDEYKTSHVSNAESYLRGSRDLTPLSEAPLSSLINLTNGMYNWQTGQMHPHAASYGSTVQLSFGYDAEATCPEFDRWVSEVVPDESQAEFWEVLGYLLMSGNPLHKAILITGVGGSGKSTFLRLVTNMLGRNNCSSQPLAALTGDKFAAVELFGKVANIAGEISDRYLADTSLFKSITGEDTISGQKKYGQPFSFTPYAVPLFSMNALPRSGDTTEGFYRRITILEFPNKVIGSRKLEEAALFADAPGIFNKAMDPLRTLMARNKFLSDEKQTDVMRDYRVANSSVLTWLEDDEVVEHDLSNEGLKVKRTEAYERYKGWCDRTNHKAMTDSNFYKELTQAGYKISSGGDRNISGVRLLPMGVPSYGELAYVYAGQ